MRVQSPLVVLLVACARVSEHENGTDADSAGDVITDVVASDTGCPATEAELKTPCTIGTVCTYNADRCVLWGDVIATYKCEQRFERPLEWVNTGKLCASETRNDGCPRATTDGEPCTVPDKVCVYDGCAAKKNVIYAFACKDGRWAMTSKMRCG